MPLFITACNVISRRQVTCGFYLTCVPMRAMHDVDDCQTLSKLNADADMASDNAVPWESGADDAEPKANTTPVRLVADTDDVLACSFSSWYPTFAKVCLTM